MAVMIVVVVGSRQTHCDEHVLLLLPCRGQVSFVARTGWKSDLLEDCFCCQWLPVPLASETIDGTSVLTRTHSSPWQLSQSESCSVSSAQCPPLRHSLLLNVHYSLPLRAIFLLNNSNQEEHNVDVPSYTLMNTLLLSFYFHFSQEVSSTLGVSPKTTEAQCNQAATVLFSSSVHLTRPPSKLISIQSLPNSVSPFFCDLSLSFLQVDHIECSFFSLFHLHTPIIVAQ